MQIEIANHFAQKNVQHLNVNECSLGVGDIFGVIFVSDYKFLFQV